MGSFFQYADLIPREYGANLRFRKGLVQRCSEDEGFRREQWILCSRDPAYWVNGYVFTYDPRIVRQPAQPFILYPFQERALETLLNALGRHDVLIEKSRDMGASWLIVLTFLWAWMYRPLQSFLVGSRKEDLVDKSGDPRSLFWKMDFTLNYLPKWMLPGTTRNKLALHNDDNGSTIDGESTNSDFARGDRRTAILLDEFAAVENGQSILAAVQDATPCTIYNSTPQGSGNAFYAKAQSDIVKLRFHWSEHPTKRVGLYTATNGSVEVLDEGYEHPPDYPFITDGKLRSPWYDNECKRRDDVRLIAQELDIDYGASDYTYFPSPMLERHKESYVALPIHVGDLEYERANGESPRFVANERGRLRLWVHPDALGKVADDRDYVVGVDVATGTGSSNSAISVGDRKTGEKVAEFVDPRMQPHELAVYAVALCRWFGGKSGPAFLIWEANGPGRSFGAKVIELGYRNLYWRRAEMALSKTQTDIPGWFSTRENKEVLLGEYREALTNGTFINRSREAVEECGYYVFRQGVVIHSQSADKEDPSGARDNHGDRVIADALCWRGLKEGAAGKARRSDVVEIPAFCFGRRQKERQDRLAMAGNW